MPTASIPGNGKGMARDWLSLEGRQMSDEPLWDSVNTGELRLRAAELHAENQRLRTRPPKTLVERVGVSMVTAAAGAIATMLAMSMCSGWGIEKPYLTRTQTETIASTLAASADAKAASIANGLKADRDKNAIEHEALRISDAENRQALIDIKSDVHEIKTLIIRQDKGRNK